MLLVGDPGTAKSQLLTFMNRKIQNSRYSCGPGCTAAGLTASIGVDSEKNKFLRWDS